VQTITPRYASSTAIIVHWELLLLAAVNLHLLGVQLIEGVIPLTAVRIRLIFKVNPNQIR